MTTRDEPAQPPDRRDLWRWAVASARPLIGWGLVVLAAVAIFLAWYGVSGESLTAKQMPYAVSGGLSGIALIVVAAVLLTSDDRRRQFGRLNDIERKVDDLYTLLVADATTPSAATSDADVSALVALPNGTTYHRANCNLVADKPEVTTIDASGIANRSLRPCPVCSPPATGATT